MNKGRYVLRQILDVVHRETFDRIVKKHKGNYRVKHFTCWHQFVCLVFGQLTHRKSLRDIVLCLNAWENKLYHIGITNGVKRSTLSEANENRNWEIYYDLAQHLLDRAREKYKEDNVSSLDLEEEVYAIDSSTIDLCMSVYSWANFRSTKSGIKLHTAINVKTEIPDFVCITEAKLHDVKILDLLEIKQYAIYIFDRAYLDYVRLYRIDSLKATFVIRAKTNIKYRRVTSVKIEKGNSVRCDQTIKLTGVMTSKRYPKKLRRIKYYVTDLDRTFVFLTNNFVLDAETIAELYKNRWRVETFFKWVKQNLSIKKFWGESENAVRIQIWIGICTYSMIAIMKKNMRIDKTMYETLQILSLAPFDKTPVNQLLSSSNEQKLKEENSNQLKMWDL